MADLPALGSRPATQPLLAAFGAALAGAALLAWTVGPWACAVALATYAVLGVLVLGRYAEPRFGAANRVTLARGVGMCLLAGMSIVAVAGQLSGAAQAAAVVIGATCLCLDGLDGRLARARGEVSEFGARFDMETDAATLLALSLMVAGQQITGWWVLAIGGIRYAYLAASWVLPPLGVRLYFSYARKVIAVIQGIALLLCLLLDLIPGVPGWLPSAVAALALTTLGWSFGRDIVWQVRRYRGADAQSGQAQEPDGWRIGRSAGTRR